jgi:GntR family transcriptional regulator/MocR family aminotransferase
LAKVVSSFELTLNERQQRQTLESWLYAELRGAILEGRLKPGARLPASRDFARLHHLSRGIIVTVFERLQTEGYLCSRVGVGTWVNDHVPVRSAVQASPKSPAYIRRAVAGYVCPKPYVGWVELSSFRPFRMRDPALTEFPSKLWGRIAARRARTFGSWVQTEGDGCGYRPLREAIAHYLG